MTDISIPIYSLLLGVPSCYIAGILIKDKVSSIKEKKHLTKVSDEICTIYDIEGYSYDKRTIVNRIFQNAGYDFFDVISNYTDIDKNDIDVFIDGSLELDLIYKDNNKKLIGNRIKIKLYNERENQLYEQALKLEALLTLLDSESSIVNMNIEDFLSKKLDLQDLVKELYYLKRRINILECLSNIYNLEKRLYSIIGLMMEESNDIIDRIDCYSIPFVSKYESCIIYRDFIDALKDKKYTDDEQEENHNNELKANSNYVNYKRQIGKYSDIQSRLEFILNQSILEAEANKKFGIKSNEFIIRNINEDIYI